MRTGWKRSVAQWDLHRQKPPSSEQWKGGSWVFHTTWSWLARKKTRLKLVALVAIHGRDWSRNTAVGSARTKFCCLDCTGFIYRSSWTVVFFVCFLSVSHFDPHITKLDQTAKPRPLTKRHVFHTMNDVIYYIYIYIYINSPYTYIYIYTYEYIYMNIWI